MLSRGALLRFFRSVETLYAMAVTRARGELVCARAERKRVLTQLDRGRRLRLLPGSQDLEKINRYQAISNAASIAHCMSSSGSRPHA
jgi:hypothetical protein